MSVLTQLLQSASTAVGGRISDETLAQINEICGRLTSVAQIATHAHGRFIDPEVAAAIDSLPNELNECGFDAWGFSPEHATKRMKCE